MKNTAQERFDVAWEKQRGIFRKAMEMSKYIRYGTRVTLAIQILLLLAGYNQLSTLICIINLFVMTMNSLTFGQRSSEALGHMQGLLEMTDILSEKKYEDKGYGN